MATELRIVQAQLDQLEHQRAVRELTSAYALDEMGNGKPLPPEVLDRLVPGLRAHPTTLIFLAYLGERAVGIANCFLGFSTFAARPLINIHDLAVLPDCRGLGVGRALLEAVERHARDRGCVKLTLEVQEKNGRARKLYESFGFSPPAYGTSDGASFFYSKPLG